MFTTKLRAVLWFVLGLWELCIDYTEAAKPKHVVFVMADDLGYGDVGYKAVGSGSAVKTPFLDSLAKNSVQMNYHYTMHKCSPTRGALMTGKYPTRFGLQQASMCNICSLGLPLDNVLMPEYMKRCGFSTHMVGKWHLGHSREASLPHKRGFDSFLGYATLVNQHVMEPLVYRGCCTRDLTYNGNPVDVPFQTYESEMVASRVDTIIREHNKTKPLFLYVPFQAVHRPLTLTSREYSSQYDWLNSTVVSYDRYQLLGMISALDRAVKNIHKSLKQAGMWEDTLFVFTSDNGGEGVASNWPLRGSKRTFYEGGIRGPTLVHHKSLTPYVSEKMMHVTDWLPTILKSVECDMQPDDIDGLDQWDSIRHENVPSPRNVTIHTIYPLLRLKLNAFKLKRYKEELKIFNITLLASVRKDNFKLITGPGRRPGVSRWKVPEESGQRPPEPKKAKPLELYNLKLDPFEENDISESNPLIVQDLLKILADHQYKVHTLKIERDPSRCSSRCSGHVLPWFH